MSASTAQWSIGGWEGPVATAVVHVRTTVLRVVAPGRGRAWVYLDGLGWRRLRAEDAQSLPGLIARCCRARLERRLVDVEVTGTQLISLGG
ncbi:MAG: hypothetical protein ABIV05_09700 [Actinomycetota bacterium]